MAASVHAQDLGALRGPIAESEVSAALLPGSQDGQGSAPTDPLTTSAIPSAPYRPASAGAVPDDAAMDPDAEDAALDTAPPAASRTPTTARQRRAERLDRPTDVYSVPVIEDTETDEAEGGAEDGRRIRRIEPVEPAANEAAQRTNLPEGARDRPPRARDDDPFAPVGLRLGTFDVFVRSEHGLTATDNADQSPTGSSSVLSETTLRLKAVSGWSRHAASVDAYGTYRKSISGQEISDVEGGLSSDLTLDISSDLRGLASLDYTLAPEDASSPVSIAGVEERPLHHVLAGSLGAEKDVGKLRFRLMGNVVRDQYGDAELDDGTTLSQEDRNETLASLTLRGGYQISPALTPFVEAEIGKRIYDQTRDSAGYARSALRSGARAGVALDFEEKLTGELSAGWISEDPEDDRLDTVSGPTVAASLAWSPMRGTIVRLDGSTMVEGTTTPGESGSILYYAQLTAERQMRANLTGTAALGFGYRTYEIGGQDTLANAELELTYWLNRYAGLTGRARYELLRSSLADRDYDAASVFLGITLQR